MPTPALDSGTPSSDCGAQGGTAPARLRCWRSRLGGGLPGMLVGLLGLLSSACAAASPSPAEMLRIGYRSPAQTFDTFRLAVRGDLAELEYNCLSDGFKERNSLGQMTYREARDELMASQGMVGRALLTRAMCGAKIEEIGFLAPDRARIRARYLGHTFTFMFVREDFWEIWAGPKALDGGYDYSWEQLTTEATDPSGLRVLWASAPLARPDFENRVTEMRVGREWKIDAFSVDDPDDR